MRYKLNASYFMVFKFIVPPATLSYKASKCNRIAEFYYIESGTPR